MLSIIAQNNQLWFGKNYNYQSLSLSILQQLKPLYMFYDTHTILVEKHISVTYE